MDKYIFLFPLLVLVACERKCELEKIPANIFDLSKIEKVKYLIADNQIDSLMLTDIYENYEKTSFQSPTNYRTCEHYKSYDVEFKGNKITVSIRKTKVDSVQLDLIAYGNCLKFKEIEISERELLQNKIYRSEGKKECESSNKEIKVICLKGYLINSIMTADGKEWIINETATKRR